MRASDWIAVQSYSMDLNKKICLAYTGLANPYSEISFLSDSGSYLDKTFLEEIKVE